MNVAIENGIDTVPTSLNIKTISRLAARIGCCLALMIALGMSGIAVHADVEEGVAKYKAGDYEGAIEEWLIEAARDNPYALFFLGQVYRLGRGVDVDLGIAEYYYSRAANLNHVAAQGNLGTLYYFAEPPLRRVEDAISWWTVAARNGDARSQYMLSVLYFNGDNVEKNWPVAYAWATLAEQGGVAEAISARKEMSAHLNAAQKTEADRILKGLLSQASAQTEAKAETPVQLAQTEQALPPVQKQAAPPAPKPEPRTTPTTPPLAQITPREGGSGASASINLPKTESATTSRPTSEPAQVADVWRVQIGAYRSVYNANSEWEKLKAQYGDILSRYQFFNFEVDLGAKGVFHRAQFGPFSDRNSAQQACDSLKARNVGCFIVRAPG
ncbi:MAG: SPOR domain-containing protein [Sphingomonadales bacterium]